MNNFIINIIRRLIQSASGPLREMLITFAKDFRTRARGTDNPWDDVLADFICLILQADKKSGRPKVDTKKDKPEA